jgi:UDP-N-acetylglucosamine transferase subunit ALG13
VIFVTIGSLFPFDRLIRLMDDLAPRWPGETFFAQTGDGGYQPRNMDFARSLPAPAFAAKLRESRLLVAHAGMGSVISALEARRPVVVLPRDMALLEHTTDHQMATARWLSGKRGIHVAMDEAALPGTIDAALASDDFKAGMSTSAPPEFLAKIRDFIEQPRGGARRA